MALKKLKKLLKMKAKFKKIIILFFFFLVFLSLCFFLFFTQKPEKVNFGVVFSQKHSSLLGLDWKENYLALLDDLKTKNLKIITHWDLIEKEKNEYHFSDLDWQIEEAEKRNVSLILVIGIKTGRWPECHFPSWIDKKNYEKDLLKFIENVVERHKDSKSIFAWQIENEPFFPFGECPEITKELVKKEIELVRSLDNRPIIFADSGEFSFWFTAAKIGDIVSITLHRRVYFKEISKYVKYPFPPLYYTFRKNLIEKLFKKRVICGEFQAEPWCKDLLYNCSLEEQKITLDEEKFKENINFALETGINTFYFWGGEWWYWQKNKGNDFFWQEGKRYLSN